MSLASGHKPANMPSYLSLFRPDDLLKNSAKGYFCNKIQIVDYFRKSLYLRCLTGL